VYVYVCVYVGGVFVCVICMCTQAKYIYNENDRSLLMLCVWACVRLHVRVRVRVRVCVYVCV